MTKVNPFNPYSPVNPGMFVGRITELDRLEAHLIQTRAGRPSNFMIIGERGIGKSSLLNYFKWLAQGKVQTQRNEKLNCLVIDTDIDQSTTQIGFIRKIELGIRKELEKTERARSFLRDSWGFLQRIEAAGVKINKTDDPNTHEIIIEEFCYTLCDIIQRICGDGAGSDIFSAKYDGVIILVDEADNASRALNLGSLLKLLLERLGRRGCSRLMIGLAGLTELSKVLVESHQSSLRMFEQLELGRLSAAEVNSVIDICLTHVNAESESPTTITDDARSLLIGFSEGYPHFIQQFGFSAFAVDEDSVIDYADVTNGAFGRNGAMEQIGDRYYRDNFYNKIQEESYRQVLRIMADKLDGWISKDEIRGRFKGKASTLDNAIKALRDKKIILSKEGTKGTYRLQHKGFAFWIKIYTTDQTEITQVGRAKNEEKQD